MPARKIGEKVFGLKGAMASGAECTPEMLAKINGYALSPLTADQVFVRKFLMAHNCIDRDNECFPPDMLDQFAATMPGKSMLVGHNRRDLPCGKFFDASTENMTPQQFQALTGEAPRLPDGTDACKVLWAWGYLLKTPGNEELIQQIDGGVCTHCSIGFAAADLTAVRKDPTGSVQYWQYVSPGEALEGSLVWLGAQPGAGAQKNMKDEDKHTQEENTMKGIIALLVGMGLKSLTDTATEEQVAAGIKSLVEEKEAKIKELEGKAADGEAYRTDLVADAVKFASLIGEVADDEKAKKDEGDFLKTLPIARLKMQRDKYEAKAREKFPTHAVFSGKDQTDRETREEQAKGKSEDTSGRKDYTKAANNELFGMIGAGQ
jgi:hypothetical protein